MKFYGLRPEDIDRMTVREIDEFRIQMATYNASNP